MGDDNSEDVNWNVDDCDLFMDVDKLLVLVSERPVIYDISRKDHYIQDNIAKAWHEIGQELNVPAAVCKAKWYVLRSSYARYLRDKDKKTPNRRYGKKKKWHLADGMTFLMPFMGVKKKNVINNKQDQEDSVQEYQNEEIEDMLPNEEECYREEVEDISSDYNLANIGGLIASEESEETHSKKRKRMTLADVVAEPMVAYFKSLSDRKEKEEHPMLLYFKGLMPEIDKLSSTSQRQFKMDILRTLNEYLDIEEGPMSRSNASGFEDHLSEITK